jgi:hypothetical protein
MQWCRKTLLSKALPPVAFVALAILGLVVAVLIFSRGLYSTTSLCRITPVSIEVDEEANVKMEIAFDLTSGAILSHTYTVDGVIRRSMPGGGGRRRSFLGHRPTGRFITEFVMDLESMDGAGSVKERAAEAIKVRIGETYLIRPDEPLLLFAFKGEDGHTHEHWIQVRDIEQNDQSPWDEMPDPEFRPKKYP